MHYGFQLLARVVKTLTGKHHPYIILFISVPKPSQSEEIDMLLKDVDLMPFRDTRVLASLADASAIEITNVKKRLITMSRKIRVSYKNQSMITTNQSSSQESSLSSTSRAGFYCLPVVSKFGKSKE